VTPVKPKDVNGGGGAKPPQPFTVYDHAGHVQLKVCDSFKTAEIIHLRELNRHCSREMFLAYQGCCTHPEFYGWPVFDVSQLKGVLA